MLTVPLVMEAQDKRASIALLLGFEALHVTQFRFLSRGWGPYNLVGPWPDWSKCNL